MDQDYKARKEAFVSNHLGGGIDEINVVTLVAPVNLLTSLRVRLS